MSDNHTFTPLGIHLHIPVRRGQHCLCPDEPFALILPLTSSPYAGSYVSAAELRQRPPLLAKCGNCSHQKGTQLYLLQVLGPPCLPFQRRTPVYGAKITPPRSPHKSHPWLSCDEAPQTRGVKPRVSMPREAANLRNIVRIHPSS
jgi:hypothetical protein